MTNKILRIEYPTLEEYNEIARNSIFSKIFAIYQTKPNNSYTVNLSTIKEDIQNYKVSYNKEVWLSSLENRLFNTKQAFVHLAFYHGKEKQRLKIDNTPNLVSSYQQQFYYHIDIFYLKLFSIFDNIAHLLDIEYKLEYIKRDISFDAILQEKKQEKNKLKSKNLSLYKALKNIQNDSTFKEAKKYRRNITHNELPSALGKNWHEIVSLSGNNGISLGGRARNISMELLFSNAQNSTYLLHRLISLIEFF